MNCPNCGAAIKFYNKTRTECEYCKSEVFKSDVTDKVSDDKDYNIENLKVINMVRDIGRYNTYKALVFYEEPINYFFENRKLIELPVEEFTVEFDVHTKSNDIYLDIISEIPQRFLEDDIKCVLLKTLYFESHLNGIKFKA